MGEKRFIVPLSEAVTGSLPGGIGTFRILIDGPTSGAQHFSLLVNTSRAGVQGREHKHDVEHCWYILSGTGRITQGGKAFPIGPGMAVYTPAQLPHRVEVDPGEDLTYVVVYAPPGPEQELKQAGAAAFGGRKG